jgi:hypothetical protein
MRITTPAQGAPPPPATHRVVVQGDSLPKNRPIMTDEALAYFRSQMRTARALAKSMTQEEQREYATKLAAEIRPYFSGPRDPELFKFIASLP